MYTYYYYTGCYTYIIRLTEAILYYIVWLGEPIENSIWVYYRVAAEHLLFCVCIFLIILIFWRPAQKLYIISDTESRVSAVCTHTHTLQLWRLSHRHRMYTRLASWSINFFLQCSSSELLYPLSAGRLYLLFSSSLARWGRENRERGRCWGEEKVDRVQNLRLLD